MSHPDKARQFQQDAERAGWHDGAVWHVRARRDAAAAAVTDWNALRDHAAQVRAHTLSRLDHYVAQLADHAVANGATVHWATDAAALRTTVGELLAKARVRRVVKSKSMLTEECGLNAHLETTGVEVIDTDLGERIVQLRGERPSHIVMPALHLKRGDVGDTFHRHMRTPPGETDPTRLTRAARHDLRGRFLAAEAGITGVNFALADSGTFVVCTNEGNADLGAHLPKLHILCMGIDKVIPRQADLPVFLRLLARSATGQPITAYTSLFKRPAPGTEMHVVIVDNGRTTVLRDGQMRPALGCIRCGACLNTCPVYRRSGGHSYGADSLPGPIGAVLSGARDARKHVDLAHASTLCGSCGAVCPVKVPLPAQLLELRRRGAGADGWKDKAMRAVLGHVLAHPERARWWGELGARVQKVLPEAVGGRALPEVSADGFRDGVKGLLEGE